MQPDQGEHHDPVSEAGRAGLERLMALGVLVEAGGRYAAERSRVRLAREEREAHHERAAQVAQERAERLARAEERRRQREWSKLVSDPKRLAAHLRELPVQEVARHWGQAAGAAGQDPMADAVLAAAEQQLRVRLPSVLQRFDRSRKAGMDRFEAMRGAVVGAFGGDGPHAQPGKRGLPALDRDLEAELRRNAGQLDPAARVRWLRAMEARGWSPESVAWAESMLVRSSDQRRAAQCANASAVDDPATLGVDERTDGLVAAGVATGRADDLARDAAAEASTAGHASARRAAAGGGGRVIRPSQAGEAARVARLSFATSAQSVLRMPNQPTPTPVRSPAPERARRGPTR